MKTAFFSLQLGTDRRKRFITIPASSESSFSEASSLDAKHQRIGRTVGVFWLPTNISKLAAGPTIVTHFNHLGPYPKNCFSLLDLYSKASSTRGSTFRTLVHHFGLVTPNQPPTLHQKHQICWDLIPIMVNFQVTKYWTISEAHNEAFESQDPWCHICLSHPQSLR